MTAWIYRTADLLPGDTTTLVLSPEVAKPAYAGMTDAAVATAISAQTEPDDGPLDMQSVRRQAIEGRYTQPSHTVPRGVWGLLQAVGSRTYVDTTTVADRQKNDVTCSARNFLALFSELENGAALVRNNALWASMDADLTVLTGTTGGAPLMSTAQATFMRGLGDRTRQKWQNGVYESDVSAIRAFP
jgi:hypothetical protein